MAKEVLFEPAVKKAARFGKKLGSSGSKHEQSSLSAPAIRKELAKMAGELIVWLTAFKARVEDAPVDQAPTVQATQRLGLEGRSIHRSVRGDLVRSTSEVAIANILLALEREGRLTYQIAPELPFANPSAPPASFKIEANGKIWLWEHCSMLADAKYRRRWEQKKELYAKNGFSVHAPDNADGRLIVTEDSLETGFDTQAIDQLTRTLFGT